MSNVIFFLTELHVLAYFTHKVRFPLLNCVEISDQSQLLHIFPNLYEDMSNGKMDTLKEFLVSYKHLPIDELESEVVQELLKGMCTDAAEEIKLQCGREYGFSDSEPSRATQLDKPSANELTGLPTNNLDIERDFSKFSRLSEVTKGIVRNLYQGKNVESYWTERLCQKAP